MSVDSINARLARGEHLSAEDRAYLAKMKSAQERQVAAHRKIGQSPGMDALREVDEIRAKASEEHMRRTRGDVTPADLVVPTNLALASTPNFEPRTNVISTISILIAEAVVDDVVSLPQAEDRYAPDWPSLKKAIVESEGTWKVSRYEFPALVPHILGFFGKGEWEMPKDSIREVFEVIVKSGRVFRSDPE